MTEADEKQNVHRYLRRGREALLWKLDGLSGRGPFTTFPALKGERAIGARPTRDVDTAASDRRSTHVTRLVQPGIWLLPAITLNTAPFGSATVARRPYGVSTGCSSTEPPSSVTRAAVASVSSTQM
jgi:hypothetical protein